MLTDNQKETLVRRINQDVDVPFVPEVIEANYIRMAVDKFDEVIDEFMPEDIQAAMQDVALRADTMDLKDAIIGELNERIDIPFVSEEQEAQMMNILWGFAVASAGKGFSVARALVL